MPGNERARVHVADRLAELVGHDDQHQRRRDDLRQRAGCGDHAGGEAPVVAVAQHDRQRDQAHRDHRGGDHAGGRGEQRADEDHGVGEAAAHRPEQLADGVEQVLGHAAALEDQPHEGEERHREQRVVRHDRRRCARGSAWNSAGVQQAELDAERGRRRCRWRRARTRPDSRAAGTRSGDANMSGAMFAMRKAVMPSSPRCLAQRFGQQLLVGRTFVPSRVGIGNQAAQEGDALDQLRDALQDQQRRSRPAPEPRRARRSGRRRWSTSRRCW